MFTIDQTTSVLLHTLIPLTGSAQKGNQMAATLHIDGLLPSVGQQEIKNIFSQYGNVLSVDIIRPEMTQSSGVGKVEMQNFGEATKAAHALHRSYLGGKLLLVFLKQEK